MAHELEIRDGLASFVAKGEKAWHGLGTYVTSSMTAEEVVKLARLDYKVGKTPIYIAPEIMNNDETMIEIDGLYCTYRTDNYAPLGIVSSRYEIVQNVEAFTFFDPIIERGEAIYETAGVLGKGERIFITAKLPEDIEVAGEKVNQYLLITNGHDGKNAIRIGFTPIRVVCNNTLTAALSDLKNSHTIHHSKNPLEQLKQASSVIGLASNYMNNIKNVFEDMANIQLSDNQLLAFIEAQTVDLDYVQKIGKPTTRSKNLAQNIYSFAKYDLTQTTSATKNTLYGAYNSISGYLGHVKNYKSANDRMDSLIFGHGNKKIMESFNFAMKVMDDISILDTDLVTI